ncbi:MAG: hypothetical protein DSY42_09280 [Aquifex sp.]|nr:MAG: hypothetical protein DSY42_09280 [Aquifex sp.]
MRFLIKSKEIYGISWVVKRRHFETADRGLVLRPRDIFRVSWPCIAVTACQVSAGHVQAVIAWPATTT